MRIILFTIFLGYCFCVQAAGSGDSETCQQERPDLNLSQIQGSCDPETVAREGWRAQCLSLMGLVDSTVGLATEIGGAVKQTVLQLMEVPPLPSLVATGQSQSSGQIRSDESEPGGSGIPAIPGIGAITSTQTSLCSEHSHSVGFCGRAFGHRARYGTNQPALNPIEEVVGEVGTSYSCESHRRGGTVSEFCTCVAEQTLCGGGLYDPLNSDDVSSYQDLLGRLAINWGMINDGPIDSYIELSPQIQWLEQNGMAEHITPELRACLPEGMANLEQTAQGNEDCTPEGMARLNEQYDNFISRRAAIMRCERNAHFNEGEHCDAREIAEIDDRIRRQSHMSLGQKVAQRAGRFSSNSLVYHNAGGGNQQYNALTEILQRMIEHYRATDFRQPYQFENDPYFTSFGSDFERYTEIQQLFDQNPVLAGLIQEEVAPNSRFSEEELRALLPRDRRSRRRGGHGPRDRHQHEHAEEDPMAQAERSRRRAAWMKLRSQKYNLFEGLSLMAEQLSASDQINDLSDISQVQAAVNHAVIGRIEQLEEKCQKNVVVEIGRLCAAASTQSFAMTDFLWDYSFHQRTGDLAEMLQMFPVTRSKEEMQADLDQLTCRLRMQNYDQVFTADARALLEGEGAVASFFTPDQDKCHGDVVAIATAGAAGSAVADADGTGINSPGGVAALDHIFEDIVNTMDSTESIVTTSTIHNDGVNPIEEYERNEQNRRNASDLAQLDDTVPGSATEEIEGPPVQGEGEGPRAPASVEEAAPRQQYQTPEFPYGNGQVADGDQELEGSNLLGTQAASPLTGRSSAQELYDQKIQELEEKLAQLREEYNVDAEQISNDELLAEDPERSEEEQNLREDIASLRDTVSNLRQRIAQENAQGLNAEPFIAPQSNRTVAARGDRQVIDSGTPMIPPYTPAFGAGMQDDFLNPHSPLVGGPSPDYVLGDYAAAESAPASLATYIGWGRDYQGPPLAFFGEQANADQAELENIFIVSELEFQRIQSNPERLVEIYQQANRGPIYVMRGNQLYPYVPAFDSGQIVYHMNEEQQRLPASVLENEGTVAPVEDDPPAVRVMELNSELDSERLSGE